LGLRMMRMGMVSTAHEQFKRLRMWPDAIDCLMAAERNVECLDMVKGLLKTSPTPRLWCCLGDLEKEHLHYITAWELSGQRFARAQRSLGRHYFHTNDFPKAIHAYGLALAINPLHGNIWFAKGCLHMRLEEWEEGAVAFSRCVGVDDDNSEAWGNLAAVHCARGCLKEARNCVAEATRLNRESWRMWESFLGICMKLRDILGCIQALKRLVELGQIPRITEQILGILTMSIVHDVDELFDNHTGKHYEKPMLDFFKFLTDSCTSEPFHWRFFAELQASKGLQADALESRLRQSRAVQARLWEEADPAKFEAQLKDLCECFESIEREFLTREQLQPFAYSVRNTQKQLQEKLDKGVRVPEWVETHKEIEAIATRLEARASSEQGASG